MVKEMRRRISLFVSGLGRSSRKERRVAMLIGKMHISRLMVYVQHVEEGKLRAERSIEARRLRQGMILDNRKVV